MTICFIKAVKIFFHSSREPANFCKVQFCEVFGWMGNSIVQVCGVLLMWLGWWKDLGRQKRNDRLHPSSVKTRLQTFYGLRLPMKWDHSRVLLKSSSLGHSMRSCSRRNTWQRFLPGEGPFHIHMEVERRGTSWGYFQEAVQDFLNFELESLRTCVSSLGTMWIFLHPSTLQ